MHKCCLSFFIGLALMFSPPVLARPHYSSNDIIVLPTPAKASLALLQKKCARSAAQTDYLATEKNCRLFLERLKNTQDSETGIPHIRLCGFYVGLLTQRLKFADHQQQTLSVANLVDNISRHSTGHDRFKVEENFLILLQALDIKVNVQKWCKKAAFQNSGYAMEVLGDFYETQGRYEDAGYWYRRAIETFIILPQNGGISAAYALGAMLALSPGASRQPQKAARLLLQSMTLGDESFVQTYLTHKKCKNCLPLQTRLHIQKILKQQGLYDGYIDGDFGIKTREAVMQLYKQPDKLLPPSQ